MTRSRRCPCCSDEGSLFAESNIDAARMSESSYSSRKRPELMHHELWRCAGCQSLFTREIPEVGALEEDYREAAFDSGEEAALASRTYIDALRSMRGRLALGAALDIGTGDGAFLERLLEFGFEKVVGVEPSEAPIALSSEIIRGRIVQDMFRPGLFAAGTFDLVTCFQTIEHVPFPEELVLEAHRVLRPGGAFAMVSHDRLSPVNRALGRRSPIYDVEHLQLLTRRGASTLLERGGFGDVVVHSILNRYPLSYWIRLAPLPGGLKSGAETRRQSRLLSLQIPLPVGNILTMGWKS